MSAYGTVVPAWANDEFTLYVGHLFKHVPQKMIFSVFRKLGLGMLVRGGTAIEFKDYDQHKSAKINFRHLFTRGGDAEKNISILQHLREGGAGAHFELTYQPERRDAATGDLLEPHRFWKVALWRDRVQSLSTQEISSREIMVSLGGGSLGATKKVIGYKTRTRPAGAHTPRPRPPPIDLSGLDLDCSQEPCRTTQPIERSNAEQPQFMLGDFVDPALTHLMLSPSEEHYSATSPPYMPDLYPNASESPDYSPPKTITPMANDASLANKSVSFSEADTVYNIPSCEEKSPVPNTLNTRDELSNTITAFRQGKFPWAGNCPSTIVGLRKWRKSQCISTPSRNDYDEQDANDVLQMELDWWVEQRYIRDPRKFQEKNPRRCGTKPFARYDAYKSATTLNDALQMGALANDLRKDVERGWVQ